jgi:hypothetical protein
MLAYLLPVAAVVAAMNAGRAIDRHGWRSLTAGIALTVLAYLLISAYGAVRTRMDARTEIVICVWAPGHEAGPMICPTPDDHTELRAKYPQ